MTKFSNLVAGLTSFSRVYVKKFSAKKKDHEDDLPPLDYHGPELSDRAVEVLRKRYAPRIGAKIKSL
jgi:hypothetical protein